MQDATITAIAAAYLSHLVKSGNVQPESSRDGNGAEEHIGPAVPSGLSSDMQNLGQCYLALCAEFHHCIMFSYCAYFLQICWVRVIS